MGTIAVVACCDTKYHEIRYVQKRIRETGHTPLIVDISIGPNLPMQGDITRDSILSESGYDMTAVRKLNKSDAVDLMKKCICATISRLYAEGRIDAVFGMGGLQNTVMCSAAFRLLPLGFPKVIVSTVASGFRYFDAVVGDKDIVVIPSIVDFSGMNVISETVLNNGVAAIAGMVDHGGKIMNTDGQFIIGTTLMGITNDTVMSACNQLAAQGREVLSFHSTGVGGRVLDQMIRDGHIKAVMDLTLHELVPEYFGNYGYCRGAENRLCAAAESGIPMLIVPGGIDFICLRKEEFLPDEDERGHVWHNSELTHTRLYEEEVLGITKVIVERLNRAVGKVVLLLPMGGLRTLSRKGDLFYKPETIRKMKEIFETGLKPEIQLKCVDYNFMDPEFADIIVAEMNALLN